MIAQIRGEVVDVGTNSVVIETAGIGYEVLLPEPVLSQITRGSQQTFMTYHHIRENGQELFGFVEPGQKELFTLLLGVSGIGPKGAMAILSLGDHGQIRQAIASGNSAYLAGAAGVGKKSAERVSVELKDKVGVIGGQVVTPAADDDAQAALEALGYSPHQAAQALVNVKSDLKTEERVKQALRELS